MPEISPVSLALEELGVPHRVFTHPGPVDSLEQAARERGHRPGQVIRSILFRLKADQYVLALMAGPAQISWKALRQHFGQSRISMASEDEVMEVTGYSIGAVGPFGLPRRLKIVIDPGGNRIDEPYLVNTWERGPDGDAPAVTEAVGADEVGLDPVTLL